MSNSILKDLCQSYVDFRWERREEGIQALELDKPKILTSISKDYVNLVQDI